MGISRRKFLRFLGIGVGATILGGGISACNKKEGGSLENIGERIIIKTNDQNFKNNFNNLKYFAESSYAKKKDYDRIFESNIRVSINNLKQNQKINEQEEDILIKLLKYYIDKITIRFFPNG